MKNENVDKEEGWLERAGFVNSAHMSDVWEKDLGDGAKISLYNHGQAHMWDARIDMSTSDDRWSVWATETASTPENAVAMALHKLRYHINHSVCNRVPEIEYTMDFRVPLSETDMNTEAEWNKRLFKSWHPYLTIYTFINNSDVGIRVIGIPRNGKNVWAWLFSNTCDVDVISKMAEEAVKYTTLDGALRSLTWSLRSLGSEFTIQDQKTSPEAQPKKRRGTRQRS